MIYRNLVPEELDGYRLDDALALLQANLSKGEVRRIIDRGGCALNASMVRVASRKVHTGDIIETGVMEPGRFRELELPESAVILETPDWISINKPPGINSQRTPFQLKGTVEYWIGERMKASGINEPVRIPHRLDRGTSGVMIFPKNKPAAGWISGCFKQGTVEKLYLAIVDGIPEETAWECNGPIGKIGSGRYGIVQGGKESATRFRVLASSGNRSLVEAVPLTGRTHQIRVHLAANGSPVTGDSTYGGTEAPRMMLHCLAMGFRDRTGGQITLTAGPDRLFTELCRREGFPLSYGMEDTKDL